MSQVDAAPGSERIKQKRGRKTSEALMSTGSNLRAYSEFESITTAGLRRPAGYSVGAFYARFRSKDEYFDALLAHHVAERRRVRERMFAEADGTDWVRDVIEEAVNYYWRRRRFWRAALMRSIHDSEFWQPVREQGHDFATLCVKQIEREAGRALTREEELHVRVALQGALGTINNTIINRPGPIFMGQAE